MYSVTLQYVLDSRKPIYNKKLEGHFFKEDLLTNLSQVKLVGFVAISADVNDLYRPFYSVEK
ncbi:hypothetical protein [Listeria seeligeri]|uniref:hypothetical protein n=1 Tax=Listeria seeligeri TaxID=1640 RepID=UPI0022EA123A|nr:hypothetical protein [Listeria seeligeri]